VKYQLAFGPHLDDGRRLDGAVLVRVELHVSPGAVEHRAVRPISPEAGGVGVVEAFQIEDSTNPDLFVHVALNRRQLSNDHGPGTTLRQPLLWPRVPNIHVGGVASAAHRPSEIVLRLV
jgi:hypothetical protein